jgi:hypothetical protein
VAHRLATSGLAEPSSGWVGERSSSSMPSSSLIWGEVAKSASPMTIRWMSLGMILSFWRASCLKEDPLEWRKTLYELDPNRHGCHGRL